MSNEVKVDEVVRGCTVVEHVVGGQARGSDHKSVRMRCPCGVLFRVRREVMRRPGQLYCGKWCKKRIEARP